MGELIDFWHRRAGKENLFLYLMLCNRLRIYHQGAWISIHYVNKLDIILDVNVEFLQDGFGLKVLQDLPYQWENER